MQTKRIHEKNMIDESLFNFCECAICSLSKERIWFSLENNAFLLDLLLLAIKDMDEENDGTRKREEWYKNS